MGGGFQTLPGGERLVEPLPLHKKTRRDAVNEQSVGFVRGGGDRPHTPLPGQGGLGQPKFFATGK